jgi:adenylyltransferase/sulfurtransferase
VLALNPAVRCEAVCQRLTADNAAALFESMDVVCDCTDNVTARYLINDACVLFDKPLVSGAAVAMDGQISVYNADGGPCYRCVHPEPPKAQGSCAGSGVLGAVPGVVGTLMAVEALKVAGGFGRPLRQRLCVYDAFSGRFRTVRLAPRRPACIVCGPQPAVRSMADSAAWAERNGIGAALRCPAAALRQARLRAESATRLGPQHRCAAAELAAALREAERPLVVDVRPEKEFRICAVEGALNVPLATLASRVEDVRRAAGGRAVFVLCRRGISSLRGARTLIDAGIEQVRNVDGGLLAWTSDVDPAFPAY